MQITRGDFAGILLFEKVRNEMLTRVLAQG